MDMDYKDSSGKGGSNGGILELLSSSEVAQDIPQMPDSNLLYSSVECFWIGLLVLFLSLVGTVANCVVLAMFVSRKEKQMSDHLIIYMTSLALLGCSVQMPMQYFLLFNAHDPIMGCNVFSPTQYFLCFHVEVASAFALVLIAFDRFVAVCRPFYRGVTPLRVTIALVTSNAVAALLSTAVIVPMLKGKYWLVGDFAHAVHGFLLACMLLLITGLYGYTIYTVHKKSLDMEKAKAQSHLAPSASKNSEAIGSSSAATKRSRKVAEVRVNVQPAVDEKKDDGKAGANLNGTEEHESCQNDNLLQAVPSPSSSILPVPLSNRNHKNYLGSKTYKNSTQSSTGSRSSTLPYIKTPSQQPNPASARKRRVLYTVVAITFLYVVCFIPGSMLSQVMYWDASILLEASPLGGAVIRYVQLLFNLNFVLSPFVYAVMAERFRKDLADVWASLKQHIPIRFARLITRATRTPQSQTRVGRPSTSVSVKVETKISTTV
ncbi:uncharacterized protein LOC134846468 [Symsagittifera roscoffensis]|uniref:uncharacterized protein LOC134846468 n=1 Tax=Symsagittifera roscoffensis TaxID=84072 RepID=UPI00307C2649